METLLFWNGDDLWTLRVEKYVDGWPIGWCPEAKQGSGNGMAVNPNNVVGVPCEHDGFVDGCNVCAAQNEYAVHMMAKLA